MKKMMLAALMLLCVNEVCLSQLIGNYLGKTKDQIKKELVNKGHNLKTDLDEFTTNGFLGYGLPGSMVYFNDKGVCFLEYNCVFDRYKAEKMFNTYLYNKSSFYAYQCTGILMYDESSNDKINVRYCPNINSFVSSYEFWAFKSKDINSVNLFFSLYDKR